MKTFLFRSMIGIFFGGFLAVVVSICLIYFGGQEVLDGQLFIRNSLGSIFCGWFFTVSPLYFENTRLRLSQQTAIHFATTVIVYFILAFGIGWISFNWINFFSNASIIHRSLFGNLDCVLSLLQKSSEEIECGITRSVKNH